MSDHRTHILGLTAGIVGGCISSNLVTTTDLPGLIASVYEALERAGAQPAAGGVAQASPAGAPVRAFTGSVRSSIKPAGIISAIDGKPYKMLRRHIGLHGYTPESYRVAFDLPSDYPMVAPEYAATRRALALKSGLGRKREAA